MFWAYVSTTSRPRQLNSNTFILLHYIGNHKQNPNLITMAFDPSPPSITTDSNSRFLGASCLDFLLIELVPMAERLVRELPVDDKQPDDEEARESTFFRLESLGYRVGQGLAER